MKKAVVAVLIAAGVGAVAVGQTIAANSGHTHTEHAEKIILADNGKVAVCHIPPGNPANRHTLHVAPSAVTAHLAHGDFVGECGGGGFIPPVIGPS